MEIASNNPKKIFISGLVQSNFIKQLYSSIHKVARGAYLFYVLDLKELSGKDEYGNDYIFERQFKLNEYKGITTLRFLFSFKLFKLIFLLFRRGCWAPKFVLAFMKRYAINQNIYRELISNGIHSFHFHFPRKEYLDMLWHLNKNDFCVISFWGSDLLRTSDHINFIFQKMAVDRADIITTHSIEMREIILAKFGRQYINKIRFTKFPPHDHLYNLMNGADNNQLLNRIEFAQKFGLDALKKWIVIGHNGSINNNHLTILEALSSLSEQEKSRCFFILPFSYKPAGSEHYERKVFKKFIEFGLEGKVFKEFLSWEDLACFRCLTDIMIHLPVSDALSGALTETIYGGANVITGSWLPYSPFRKANISLQYIDGFDDLKVKFNEVLDLPRIGADQLKTVRNSISDNFLSDTCAKTWLPIFDSNAR